MKRAGGRRTAAMHAAEAILAQAGGLRGAHGAANGPGEEAGPPASPDLDGITPLVTRGRRTARKRNLDLLAGVHCLHTSWCSGA